MTHSPIIFSEPGARRQWNPKISSSAARPGDYYVLPLANTHRPNASM